MRTSIGGGPATGTNNPGTPPNPPAGR